MSVLRSPEFLLRQHTIGWFSTEDGPERDGETLQAGAVALVKRVRNPIRLARLIMERTDHVMIAGSGAERLAMRSNILRDFLPRGSMR
jgi:hypothetical protein